MISETNQPNPHDVVCEMTFRLREPRERIDLTRFHWALGVHGGIIVPIRDFGVSNIELDGMGLIYVKFDRPVNHRSALEVKALAKTFGLVPTTREAAVAQILALRESK
jgi:hypothetical protein